MAKSKNWFENNPGHTTPDTAEILLISHISIKNLKILEYLNCYNVWMAQDLTEKSNGAHFNQMQQNRHIFEKDNHRWKKLLFITMWSENFLDNEIPVCTEESVAVYLIRLKGHYKLLPQIQILNSDNYYSQLNHRYQSMKTIRNWPIRRMSVSIRTTSELTSLCRPSRNWYSLTEMSYYTSRIHLTLNHLFTTYFDP